VTPGLEADSSPEDLADFGRVSRPRLLVLAWVAGCSGNVAPAPIGSRIGPALTAALQPPIRRVRRGGVRRPTGRLADETLKPGQDLEARGQPREARGAGATTIGVIADAGFGRAHGRGTRAVACTARGRLTSVIALGGMGSSQAELDDAQVARLAAQAAVAVPGDLEACPCRRPRSRRCGRAVTR
jgi:hypothetical protein